MDQRSKNIRHKKTRRVAGYIDVNSRRLWSSQFISQDEIIRWLETRIDIDKKYW